MYSKPSLKLKSQQSQFPSDWDPFILLHFTRDNPSVGNHSPILLSYLVSNALDQGFSNFWFYGAHEEIDHNLRSPTINFYAVIAAYDSCKISQVSILIRKRTARGDAKFGIFLVKSGKNTVCFNCII